MKKITTYESVEVRRSYLKSCSQGWEGDSVEYVVPKGRFTSINSQEEADAMAIADCERNGPLYAEKKGKCRPKVWMNNEVSVPFYKNDCGYGIGGSRVDYVVVAGKHISYESQEDADQKAYNEANEKGQEYANATGRCCEAYVSSEMYDVFYKNDCPDGYGDKDGVPYSIEKGRYVSKISQRDAEDEARKILIEEGQAYANEHGSCVPMFKSRKMSGVYQKDNCPPGYKGKSEYYSLEEGYVISFDSQEEADREAKIIMDKEGQELANQTCECEPVFFEVKVKVIPEGKAEVEGADIYGYGDVCIIKITPEEDYQVNKLLVNGVSVEVVDNQYEFEVHEDTNVIVRMSTDVTYTIEASAAPLEGGSVLGGGEFKLRETCPLVATENAGYNFSGWYRNGVIVSNSKAYSFIVSSNTAGKYVALFTE